MSQVSTVKNARDVDCQTADAAELVRGFRAENSQIAKIRETYADAGSWGIDPKESIGELKKSLPGVLWSGTFAKRGKDHLVKYSGLLVADLDNLGTDAMAAARGVLVKNEHVWALFASPSGAGLKVVFRVKEDAALHLRSFRAAEKVIRELCGLEVDQSGKDLARLCFVSADPEAYLNEAAVQLEPAAEEKKGEKFKPQAELVSIMDITKRKTVVESLLSGVRWESETVGFCDCPGIRLHTQGDGPKDAKITLDGVPTLFCFHNSCKVEVEAVNREIRSRIAKLELVAGGIREEKAALTVMELAALDPVAYEKVRREEAKRMEVRPSVLDELVKAQRKRSKLVAQAAEKNEKNGVDWESDDKIAIYDASNMGWWITTKDGGYTSVNENGVRRVLQAAGFEVESEEGEMSPMARELMRRQQDTQLSFVGPIAGYPVGLHLIDGGRVLVPSASPGPEGKDVPCSNLRALLEGMLQGEQFGRFIAWLKFRRMSVKENKWMPGQAVAFVGPAQSGKSFTQYLITLLLGGRVAKPWRYLSGGTEFNGDLIGTPHLAVEDDAPKPDLHTRRLIGSQIKSMLYSRMQSAHAKYSGAIHLDPKWTLTFSLNDEAENLAILPPIDESLKDKLTIFKCSRVPRPVPPELTEQEWLEQIIKNELQGLAWLVDTMEVPDAWFDPRSGVAAYRHRETEAILSDASPESELLEIIDDVLFEGPSVTKWEGKSSELTAALRSSHRNFDCIKLDTYRNAIPTYLGRLASQTNARVIYKRTSTSRIWIIYRQNCQPDDAVENDQAENSTSRPF